MPTHPWAVTWRKAIVSAPRLVPDVVLRFTSPEGPQPVVINIPSRGEHTIPLYVFVPLSISKLPPDSPAPSLPILLDFHGGGFVLGSCQEQAPICAKLCRELNCIAMSVDYRLGPYAQFPAALEDAEDVLNAVLKPAEPGYAKLRGGINDFLKSQGRAEVRIDRSRVALAGFSAGSNLALNLVMNMGPPELPEPWPCPFDADHPYEIPVLMYYAAIDLRKLPSEREIVAGFHEIPKSFFSSLQLEQHLMPTYLPRDKVLHPRASPALAPISGLHNKVRCLLILAEKDSLSVQNEVWMKKAADEGRASDISVQKYMGVVHGWTQFPDSWLDRSALDNKYEAHDRACEFVKGLWGGRQAATT